MFFRKCNFKAIITFHFCFKMIKNRLNLLINLRTGLRTFELQNSQKLRNLSLTQILGVLIKKKACIGKAKSCLHKVHLTICFGESEACGKTKTFVSQHVKFKIMMNKPLTKEFGYNRKKITGPGKIRLIQ